MYPKLPTLKKYALAPCPVYVASMDDGREVRFSFWQDRRKPWAFPREAARLFGYRGPYEWVRENGRWYKRPTDLPKIKAAQVFHSGKSIPDPLRETKAKPQTITAAQRRDIAKRAAEVIHGLALESETDVPLEAILSAYEDLKRLAA